MLLNNPVIRRKTGSSSRKKLVSTAEYTAIPGIAHFVGGDQQPFAVFPDASHHLHKHLRNINVRRSAFNLNFPNQLDYGDLEYAT